MVYRSVMLGLVVLLQTFRRRVDDAVGQAEFVRDVQLRGAECNSASSGDHSPVMQHGRDLPRGFRIALILPELTFGPGFQPLRFADFRGDDALELG